MDRPSGVPEAEVLGGGVGNIVSGVEVWVTTESGGVVGVGVVVVAVESGVVVGMSDGPGVVVEVSAGG